MHHQLDGPVFITAKGFKKMQPSKNTRLIIYSRLAGRPAFFYIIPHINSSTWVIYQHQPEYRYSSVTRLTQLFHHQHIDIFKYISLFYFLKKFVKSGHEHTGHVCPGENSFRVTQTNKLDNPSAVTTPLKTCHYNEGLAKDITIIVCVVGRRSNS